MANSKKNLTMHMSYLDQNVHLILDMFFLQYVVSHGKYWNTQLATSKQQSFL